MAVCRFPRCRSNNQGCSDRRTRFRNSECESCSVRVGLDRRRQSSRVVLRMGSQSAELAQRSVRWSGPLRSCCWLGIEHTRKAKPVSRRMLGYCARTARPSPDKALRLKHEVNESCPWCQRQLIHLVELNLADKRFALLGISGEKLRFHKWEDYQLGCRSPHFQNIPTVREQ